MGPNPVESASLLILCCPCVTVSVCVCVCVWLSRHSQWQTNSTSFTPHFSHTEEFMKTTHSF